MLSSWTNIASKLNSSLTKAVPRAQCSLAGPCWTMLDHAGPLVRWHHKPSNWQGGPAWRSGNEPQNIWQIFLGSGLVIGHMMMLNHFTVSISSFQKLRFDEVRLVGDTLISWDLWNAKPFQLHNLEKLGNSMVRYGLQRARSQVHTSTLSPSAKKI